MRTLRRRLPGQFSIGRVCLAMLWLALTPGTSQAEVATKWTDVQLSDLSELAVIGRVQRVATAWDRVVGTIYTYVTVEVEDVLRGSLHERVIVVKVLGGRVGDVALVVPGQAVFTVGEEVLLFLESRPRDGTLMVAGLWQGKWTIEADRGGGEAVAVRTNPTSGGFRPFGPSREVRAWRPWIGRLRASQRLPEREPIGGAGLTTASREAQGATSTMSSFIDGKFGWVADRPVPVELRGVNNDALRAAIVRGATTTSATAVPGWRRLAWRDSAQSGCPLDFLDRGRVTVTSADSCGEMGHGISALVGVYVQTGDSVVREAFVLRQTPEDPAETSTSSASSVIVSAVGQVLNESGVSAAPIADKVASSPAAEVGPDVLARPTGLAAASTYPSGDAAVGLAWDVPVNGQSLAGYIIEAGSAPGLADLASIATMSSEPSFIATRVPPGTYYVRVRVSNGDTVSAPSNEVVVSIRPWMTYDAATSFGPLWAIQLQGRIVTVSWRNQIGTGPFDSYIVQVGSAFGMNDIGEFDARGAMSATFSDVPPGIYYVTVVGVIGSRRTPTVNFAGLIVTPSCGYLVNRVLATPGRLGGANYFNVFTSHASCAWTATKDRDWLDMRTPDAVTSVTQLSGVGDGWIYASTGPQFGPTRIGIIKFLAGGREIDILVKQSNFFE